MAERSSNLAKLLMSRIAESRKTVLVVGDAIVDRWIVGRVEECQDDCKKLVQDSVIDTPGGAANAARSICNWRVPVVLYCQRKDRCIKTRLVSNGKILIRHDKEVMMDPTEHTDAYSQCMTLLPRTAAAVLLSDYDKGYLTPEFIQELADVCHRYGIPCVADCKRNMSVYNGYICKGNARYWGSYALPEGSVATYGPDRPSVSGEVYPVGPELSPVRCANHVGAGDCFAAHLTLALAYGFSLKEAAILAHSAGRVYVQHPYNRPPHPEEIAADLDSATAM